MRRALKLAEDEQTMYLVLLSALRENVFGDDGHEMLRKYIGGEGRVCTPDNDSVLRRAIVRIRAGEGGNRASGIKGHALTSALEMQGSRLSYVDDVFVETPQIHSSATALENLWGRRTDDCSS